MYTQCVTAVFNSVADAENAVRALEARGFTDRDVSIATQNVEEEIPQAAREELQYGDQGVVRTFQGAGIGGLFGAIMGSPLLLVSGVGSAVVLGPIAGAATGIVVGSFLGGMSGWGVHEDHIQQYEDQVEAGKTLVVVNGDADALVLAEEILRASYADEVHVHAQGSEDAPEVDDRAIKD